MQEEHKETENNENADEQAQTSEPVEQEVHITPESEEGHTSRGIIIGVLIIVLVVILGALYLWGRTLSQTETLSPPPSRVNNEPETPRVDADIEILETLSNSDEISAIEADLESTDLNSLDSELESIEAELDF